MKRSLEKRLSQSRSSGGRPQIDTGLRVLIRRISTENPLWGAPRIHGELVKLGFEIAQSSVAKYMVNGGSCPTKDGGPSRNHAPEIAAMVLFVVPTIGFDLLYAFVVVRLDRGFTAVIIRIDCEAFADARKCRHAERCLESRHTHEPAEKLTAWVHAIAP
jgi:hypothetical protein